MKASFVIILTGGIVLVAGMIVYLNRQKTSPPLAVELVSSETDPRLERLPVAAEEPIRAVSEIAAEPDPDAVPVSSAAEPEHQVTPAPQSTPFTRAMDTLISSQASFHQKQATWKQLRDAGQLDQAIEALKQGVADHPDSATHPAALGQAQLQKAGVVAQSGGAISEMGILGMQADQSFDAALKLDPANWEAQFFKAAAMSHWPLELNKGEEVIKRMSNLIDQQERMSPQPEFAQTYVLLGEQYQKMGKSDYAAATWQIGAEKFPANPALRQKNKGK